MDFAMDNLGQLTILLESKFIERLWFCQIHFNDDKVSNNLRKTGKHLTDRPDGSTERPRESGQGHKVTVNSKQ